MPELLRGIDSRAVGFAHGCAWPVTPYALLAQSQQITDAWNFTEARQFDFRIGKWDVNLRRIQFDNTWNDSVLAVYRSAKDEYVCVAGGIGLPFISFSRLTWLSVSTSSQA